MTKTLRLLFVVALALVVGNIDAQTVITFDASEDKGSRTTENPGEDMITKKWCHHHHQQWLHGTGEPLSLLCRC